MDSGSKSITAQHLVDLLQLAFDEGELDQASLRTALPTYVVEAIDYATGGPILAQTPEPPDLATTADAQAAGVEEPA